MLHFAHANGFPPGCYTPLLRRCAGRFRVLAMHQRPLWRNSDPAGFAGWHTLADDLIRFLDENKLTGVVGAGHSMGAVATIIAAAKRPDLFSRLVLIEPVLFPLRFYFFMKPIPPGWREKIVPIAKIALKRKDKWKSKEEVLNSWRRKKIFSHIPDAYFSAFVDGAIKENANGSVSLIYPKKWEARIYCTPPNVWSYLSLLKHPTLAIKADGTNLLTPPVWKKWKKVQPNADFHIVENSTHLVPLEKPEKVLRLL